MYLVKLAHELVVKKIKEQYEKIYDRTSGHFYYYYTGIEVDDDENEVRGGESVVGGVLFLFLTFCRPRNHPLPS